MVISKFALMRQGMSLEDGQLKRLFRRLCRKYKTGNTLPKAILAKHVDNSDCGCSGCWLGLCPTKLLHQDYTIGENSSETHDYPLHISEGVTLTVYGNLVSNLMTVAGTLIVHGTHTHKNLTILKTGRYHVHGTSSASTEAAKTNIDTDTTNKYFLKNTGTFTVEQGATYTNSSTAMFVNDNIVDINGTFVNNGTFDAVGITTVETSGTFTNNYEYQNFSTTVINGTFNNNKNTSNNGSTGATMTINGTVNNNSAAEFDNGVVDDSVDVGILILNGTFNNSGLFYNYNVLSSMTTNPGSSFTNTGTLTNYSNITIGGTFLNKGLFDAVGITTILTSGTFTNNYEYQNFSTTVINGTFNNTYHTSNNGSTGATMTINGTVNNYSAAEFDNGVVDDSVDFGILILNGTFNNNGLLNNYNVLSSMTVNGTFTNNTLCTNHFNATFTVNSTGTFYNKSGFNNYSNLLTIYGNLQNSGTITSGPGCVMTIHATNKIGTINQYTGGLVYVGGTLDSTNITTTAISDYRLQHTMDTTTHSQHNIPLHGSATSNNDDALYLFGINSSYISTIYLYSSENVELATHDAATNDFISNTNAQQSNVTVRILNNWFSDYLVTGNAYRFAFKLKDGMNHTSTHEFYTVATGYPFIYSPS
jgi:hypothetical protein